MRRGSSGRRGGRRVRGDVAVTQPPRGAVLRHDVDHAAQRPRVLVGDGHGVTGGHDDEAVAVAARRARSAGVGDFAVGGTDANDGRGTQPAGVRAAAPGLDKQGRCHCWRRRCGGRSALRRAALGDGEQGGDRSRPVCPRRAVEAAPAAVATASLLRQPRRRELLLGRGGPLRAALKPAGAASGLQQLLVSAQQPQPCLAARTGGGAVLRITIRATPCAGRGRRCRGRGGRRGIAAQLPARAALPFPYVR